MRASVVLLLTMGAGLSVSCRTPRTVSESDPSASASPRPSSPRRAGPREEPAAAVDLEALLAPVPEYAGTGRNLFAFGRERSAGTSASDTGAVEPPIALPATTSIPTPRPAPSAPGGGRLAVKYAGFLEKTGADGAKAKYAIFLDGNEILAGAEGEIVANRFTVVEIGLESVTVSTQGSSTTQRIPLQSN
jgi:hypothetical protein